MKGLEEQIKDGFINFANYANGSTADGLDVLKHTDKAIMVRNSFQHKYDNNNYTTWIPKSALMPLYKDHDKKIFKVYVQCYTLKQWFRKKMKGNYVQCRALGY